MGLRDIPSPLDTLGDQLPEMRARTHLAQKIELTVTTAVETRATFSLTLFSKALLAWCRSNLANAYWINANIRGKRRHRFYFLQCFFFPIWFPYFKNTLVHFQASP